QDHSMLHVTRKTSPLKIGDEVTVGHRATLHGCTIGNRVLVGMGAIVLDDAEVGDDCIVGAGALVTKGMKVPAGHLVMGAPAKIARPLKPEELAFLPQSAENYVKDSAEYQGYVHGPERHGRDDADLEDVDGFEEDLESDR
ncbi:MAG: gamma carbonic anhydrase family protein, partial [Bdellovibrionota bacterium]